MLITAAICGNEEAKLEAQLCTACVRMELKVWVDGIQRVVCGVTEATTCQEVVIALAQAIGKLHCSRKI